MSSVIRSHVVVAACAGVGLASAAIGQTTTMVSVTTAGAQIFRGQAHAPSISDDGRFVAFHTSTDDLVPNDTNGQTDVFVHDRQTGVMERVSVTSTGAQSFGGPQGSAVASISADGRYVAFESVADNLVPNDTNGRVDIFVRDRVAGTTIRVSVTSAGAQVLDGDASGASISADGTRIAFLSNSAQLVPPDTNGSIDVFLHDTLTGQTTRQSVATGGAQGDGGSVLASLSANGAFLAFASHASNLVPGDNNGFRDVFWRDIQNGVTTRVSVDSAGVPANFTSGNSSVSISGDGRLVAFGSDATNLVPDDTNTRSDVFVRDTLTNQTTRVSVSSAGGQAVGGNSDFCDISADGLFVSFFSSAGDSIAPGGNGIGQVYLRDLTANLTTRVSVSGYITSFGQPGNAQSVSSSVASGGRYVAFASGASNLAPPDSNGTGGVDIFVHDRKTACPGDIDNDAVVGFIDLNILLTNYAGPRCY